MNILVLASGLLFGAGLVLSGMANPSKVVGFLDVTGAWDPSLAFVMIGAIGVFAPLSLILRRRGHLYGGKPGPEPVEHFVDRWLLIGAVLFGLGWGLCGFCPGPAVTGLGMLRAEALVFVPAMIVGMVLAQRLFGADPER